MHEQLTDCIENGSHITERCTGPTDGFECVSQFVWIFKRSLLEKCCTFFSRGLLLEWQGRSRCLFSRLLVNSPIDRRTITFTVMGYKTTVNPFDVLYLPLDFLPICMKHPVYDPTFWEKVNWCACKSVLFHIYFISSMSLNLTSVTVYVSETKSRSVYQHTNHHFKTILMVIVKVVHINILIILIFFQRPKVWSNSAHKNKKIIILLKRLMQIIILGVYKSVYKMYVMCYFCVLCTVAFFLYYYNLHPTMPAL